MGADLDQFWGAGLTALSVGIIALIVLIRRDLVPAGPVRDALGGETRWFLAGGLGIGIFAFSLKLLVVYLLSSYPEQTIAPLLANKAPRPPATTQMQADLVAAAFILPAQSTNAWTALPGTAPAPLDNPTTRAKIALGQRLFNDPRLSADETVSCASCHDLGAHGGADGRTVAEGVGGARGSRNTPTVFNAAFQARLFWDGRAASLEEQAKGPLLNPIEMAMPSPQAVVERVARDRSYRQAFKSAFGPDAPITLDTIAKAMAAYERTLVTNDTPYDRFINGDDAALSPSQKKGMYLFAKLGCKVCHAGANFSGASLIGPRRPFAHLRTDRLDGTMLHGLAGDKGRPSSQAQYGQTQYGQVQFGLWRIPSLRNVALTAPYFHNGSVTTLTEAVRVMARAQLNAVVGAPEDGVVLEKLEWVPKRQRLYISERRHVSEQDIADIVAFLNALTSDRLRNRMQVKTARN